MRKINLNKKQILLLGLVVALGAAIILNWRLSLAPALDTASDAQAVSASVSSGSSSSGTGKAASGYFAAARLTRQQTNAQAEDLLNSLTQISTVTTSDLQSIQSAISDFKNIVAGEGTLESMIKAKGFPDCVVFINNGLVNVVVCPKSGDLLADEDVQQIQEIITQQTKLGPESIRIVVAK